MSQPQIRSNQLITTFGPGAMVDLPDKSIIVAGLDRWSYEKGKPCLVDEPRLAAKLARLLRQTSQGFTGQTIELRTPPPANDNRFQPGGVTPGVCGYIFPHWFIVQNVELSTEKHRRRRLVLQGEIGSNGKFRDKDKSYSVVPVRFVRGCRKGHVGDIQWRSFAHYGDTPCPAPLWMEERGTTGDLSDVWIVCECGSKRSLSDAAEKNVLGKCNGSRPWLDDVEGTCDSENRLLVRTASNAYFPQTLPVISIPNSMSKAERVVLEMWDGMLCNIKTQEALTQMRGLMPAVAEKLAGLTDAGVFEVMQAIREGKGMSSVAKPIKEVEFDALSGVVMENPSDDPDGDFFARKMDTAAWACPQLEGVEKVILVHRLREVVALLGFTRFEPESADITGELDIKVQRAPIARNPKWMPVSENRGEGIFLQFKASALTSWLAKPQVQARHAQLQESFEKWRDAHPSVQDARMPGLPYIMLHSLSHLLISAISLECGYPLSSLRERIYAPDAEGAMGDRFGILIYTSSSGAEGTLGGLIHAARDIRKHLFRAMQLGTLCSNDPVCSSGGGRHGGIDRIAGSACHGCLYISETSCERFNQFLDRSLVVPTIDRRGCEFLTL